MPWPIPPNRTPTLGDMSEGLVRLEVACSCGRRGEYDLRRLVERHGADMRLLDYRYIVAADCPRMIELERYRDSPCAVRFPQLWAEK